MIVYIFFTKSVSLDQQNVSFEIFSEYRTHMPEDSEHAESKIFTKSSINLNDTQYFMSVIEKRAVKKQAHARRGKILGLVLALTLPKYMTLGRSQIPLNLISLFGRSYSSV